MFINEITFLKTTGCLNQYKISIIFERPSLTRPFDHQLSTDCFYHHESTYVHKVKTKQMKHQHRSETKSKDCIKKNCREELITLNKP